MESLREILGGEVRCDMTEDHDLLIAVAGGDAEALHQLYLRYHPRLWRYLWFQLGDDAMLVEEVMQDVFVAIWRAASRYRGTAQVATWIFRIARYTMLNARRDQARQVDRQFPSSEDLDADQPSATLAPISPEDAVIDRLMLAEALHQLSPKHQEVLELLFYHGFTPAETAEILEVPAGTVRSRLSYARRELQRILNAANEGRALR